MAKKKRGKRKTRKFSSRITISKKIPYKFREKIGKLPHFPPKLKKLPPKIEQKIEKFAFPLIKKTKLKKQKSGLPPIEPKEQEEIKSELPPIEPKEQEEIKSELPPIEPKEVEKLSEQFSKPKKAKDVGKLLESYEIEVDKAKVEVEIRKQESGITYELYVPEIGIATAQLLGEIRNELVSITTVTMKEILDPSSFNDIKKRFMSQASGLLKKRLPNIEPKLHEFLVGKLMQDMLGLGVIEFLVGDVNLEEVIILSSKEQIRVYHKKYGWLQTNLRITKEEEIINYSNIVARRVGRQITVLTPLLDAHLVTGDRVNAVLFPISTKGNTITIRKFARDPYTIIDLIKGNACNLEIAALLWLAVEYEMNVLISGGTASGKTTFLNSCMPFIPPNHRIISVEDTRELMLPDFLYWTPLVTRTANPEGKGEVSMLDLLVNSLRMRPDRIIVGEIRRQREAEVLFEAMHTGHSVYSTVHADTAAETIARLTNPPVNVPPNLLKVVNLNVVMFRDRRKGIRRVFQIAEFITGKDRAEANLIYRWIPEEDKFVKHSESSKFFEDISRNTGMSEAELNKDIEVKKKILSWLIKNNIRELNEFGRVMNLYYTDRETLLEALTKNDIKKVIGR